jgi:proliferating cell nuclear antigen
MDNSHIMLIEISIPGTWFDSYEITNPTTIGLNTTSLNKIIKIYQKGQVIDWWLNHEDICNFHFHGEKNGYESQFTLPLVSLDEDLLQIPESEYDVEFKMVSEQFAKIITQLKEFNDTMTIIVNEHYIVMTTSTETSSLMTRLLENTEYDNSIPELNLNYTAIIKTDDVEEFMINEGEEIIATFSLKYLKDIVSINKLSPIINIQLSRESPIKLTYHFTSGVETEGGPRLNFFVAPNIINDEE